MIQQTPRNDPGDAQWEADRAVAQAMIDRGGNFVHQLGLAFMRADEGNQARIREAFPDYWAQYAQGIEVRGVKPTGTGDTAAADKQAAKLEELRRALNLTAWRFAAFDEMPPVTREPVAIVIAPEWPAARRLLELAGITFQYIRPLGKALDVEACGIAK